MNYQIRCPNNHLLQIQEAHLGRKVRCPACQSILLAQPPAPAAVAIFNVPDLDEDSAPLEETPQIRRKPKRSKRAAPLRLSLTRLGVLVHSLKILCFLASPLLILSAVVLVYLAAALPSRELADPSSTLLLVSGGLMGFTPLLGILGALLCIWVPSRPGGKLLILAVFLIDMAAIVAGAACLVENRFDFVGAGDKIRINAGPATFMVKTPVWVGAIIAYLLLVTAWLFFMTFLRGIFAHYEDSTLTDEARSATTFSALLLIATPVYFGLACWMALYFLGLTNWMVATTIFIALLVIWIISSCKLLFRLLVVTSGARNFLTP